MCGERKLKWSPPPTVYLSPGPATPLTAQHWISAPSGATASTVLGAQRTYGAHALLHAALLETQSYPPRAMALRSRFAVFLLWLNFCVISVLAAVAPLLPSITPAPVLKRQGEESAPTAIGHLYVSPLFDPSMFAPLLLVHPDIMPH
jgi:hypothetical protein